MIKTLTVATLAASLVAGAALAQPAAPAAPAAAPAAAAPAAAPGKLSVSTSQIADIAKNPKAKAALEKLLPEIAQYYDQIGTMTLVDVAPMSNGALDDAKLKALQAEFNTF
jgi:hypothetical protein